MKILFWLLVAVDVAALLFFFVLGLAAAPSSRTSPLTVAFSMLLVPGLILGAAILLFMRGTSPLARGGGLLLAGAPLLLLLGLRAREAIRMQLNSDEEGNLTWFRAGPVRDIAAAIGRGDSAAVAALATKKNVNTKGYMGRTLLMVALQRLDSVPQDLGPLRALIAAGADPNQVAGGEWPLTEAMLHSDTAGVEPVLILLKAGANPNTTDQFGKPLFFLGAGVMIPPEVLTALLDHGAELNKKDRSGRGILFDAAGMGNWRAVLVLLERGVDYKQGRSINGETFPDMVDYYLRVYGDTAGVLDVVDFLKRH